MSYSKAQFIAYRLYTGQGHDPDRYIGLGNEADDVRQRVKLMTEAVNAAGACALVDRSPDVLKIFIAPEFYFRGLQGAYTDLKYVNGEGAGRDAQSIVGGLANAVQDARWKDWLFVFGTSMVVAGPFLPQDYIDPKTGKPYANLAGKKTALLNFALVQKGGFASEDERTSKAVAVTKDFLSGVDLESGQGVVIKDADYFPRRLGSYASEVNTPSQSGGGGSNGGAIFKMDDITFGLEVCADHGMARLRKATPQAGDSFVQIQLIPSCGMVMTLSSVAAPKGGLVCNVDGASPQLATTPQGRENRDGFHSELYSVVSDGRPSDLSRDMKEITPLTTIRANADLAEVQKVFWLPPDNDARNLALWSPDLAIYTVVDIPAPKVAGA